MFKNYLKTAWRNLINTKFYSALNIVGLTIGLAVGMLILIWVQEELSYDQFHAKGDNIYKVNASIGTGASKQVWGGVPGPVAAFALKEVPGVVSAVRVVTSYDYSVFRYKDKLLKEDFGKASYVDNAFFTMFDFKLLKGNIKTPFPNDQSIVITESTAKRYFGNEDPIGKTLTGDSKDPYTVSGVLADFPANSSIGGDILFSINVKKKQYTGKDFWKSMDQDWGNYYTTTFLQIRPDASTKAIADKLTDIHMKNQPGIKPTDGVFQLQALKDIHLYNPDGTSAGIQIVKIFSIVAVLILLIACINYINLSTARSMLRSKEVSVRKIIGAERSQLFMQFIIETVLCFSIAMVLAFTLIYAVMPVYNSISGKQMHFDLFNSNVWQVIALTIIATLVASSIYPAMLLSSFKPISALKGKVAGAGNATFRKILVVCQFAFSVGLIIGTLIINKQLQYIHSIQLGYDKEHVFALPMRAMQDHYEAIKAELLSHTEIKGVSTGNTSVIIGNGSTGDTDWDGKAPDVSLLISPFDMDKDFIGMFKLKFAAGTGFTGTKSDSAHYILNETAIKLAGIKDPIGKRFKLHNLNGTIIGVVKDFHFASLKQTIEPAVFSYRPSSWQMFVKTTGKDAPAAIKLVEKYWKQYNANFPYEYSFLDDAYNEMYRSEQHTSTLFNMFAGIAVFISCLGLFGLATYTAQIKVKEIGIRKVLGASVTNITTMLSRDFLVLVLLAIIIASPIAWYAMNEWLMDYAYRAEIHWWLIAVAGGVAVVVAFATISFQAVKAALANPVKSLRSE
ncbi:putative ABC transport system permease protein [Mucilaginibacter gossypiicola]|uniref:Putative ABC transport system permease protein n=1 Tax=Mucilaginibacter gossypiicola TaxID=551995 RepID=A0A1H7ZDP9_9SPHI|nr:ABC transporter permease [Mucilaginibacter gossypiicola]SEM56672.1 putative ABC transport system permease protein [Mucilaginibacter gossypiicola]